MTIINWFFRNNAEILTKRITIKVFLFGQGDSANGRVTENTGFGFGTYQGCCWRRDNK
jgi:hypothetical protein